MVESLEGERSVKRAKYDCSDFAEHDLICSKFKLYFCNDIGASSLPPPSTPTFIHQFYPNIRATLEELEGCELSMQIDARTLNILFEGMENGKELAMARLQELLSPILCLFPVGRNWITLGRFYHVDCCYFDEKLFKAACEAKGEISDKELHTMNSRIQPLLLFFIDGASIINSSDSKWLLHFLTDSSGALIGFCSAYPFLRFPDKRRLRISQFFVLPPLQRQGYGSALYRAIMRTAGEQVDVEEVTVEDPSEAFSDFRLVNDVAMLQEALQPKLTPLQKEEVDHFISFQRLVKDHQRPLNPEDEEFIVFRKQLKKYLLKRYPEISSAPKDEKFAILERLFNDEVSRFQRILKLHV